MTELKPYGIWLILVMAHITADGKFYPYTEHTIKTSRKINGLFTALFLLQIEPGEAFRFMCRCYPETIELIRHSNQTIAI